MKTIKAFTSLLAAATLALSACITLTALAPTAPLAWAWAGPETSTASTAWLLAAVVTAATSSAVSCPSV